MKKSIQSIYLLFIIFSFAACKKSVDEPVVTFTASKTSVTVRDTVNFVIHGIADGFSIYTGDAGHDFEKSKYVLTQGKDITTEAAFLTQAKYDDLQASGLVADPAILNLIKGIIGKRYEGRSHVEELLKEFYNYTITDANLATIVAYFTVESNTTAPTGSYATGVGIDSELKNKVYSYKYTTAGTYTVTLFATSVGRKNYSGNGYKNTRVTYDSEYNRTVVLARLTITVSP